MEKLETLIEKTVQQLGYELVDLEISNRGKLLRVYIDKPDSVTIDDCTLVSNHLGHVFTVEQDLDYDRLFLEIIFLPCMHMITHTTESPTLYPCLQLCRQRKS